MHMFTAEIIVLFVVNRQWNTLEIVCSGATDYGRLVKTNVKVSRRRNSISFQYMHACNIYYRLKAITFPVIMT